MVRIRGQDGKPVGEILFKFKLYISERFCNCTLYILHCMYRVKRVIVSWFVCGGKPDGCFDNRGDMQCTA